MDKIKLFLILLIMSVFCRETDAQTRLQLEEQRRKALEDIEYVDNLLKKTSSERTESMGQLNMISRKLSLRANVIEGIINEMNLLDMRIGLNELAIELMEYDLRILIRDYEKAILHAQKASKTNPELAYIMAAKDLNQGYKRIKYLQQVAKYRRREAELIFELKEEVEKNRAKLEVDYNEINLLGQREESEKEKLKREQDRKRSMINSLAKKERQLKRELQQKQRIAEEIEKEIERVIEEERKKRNMTELTPEEKLIGEDFSRNKGLLPWPVEVGVITSQFGVHDHPVIKGTKIDNIGVEITSGKSVSARAVFGGRVMSVFGITGGNMAIIIRHGKYLTVYQNLVNVTVKPGDNVATKQFIGNVFSDPREDGKSIIKFMVYEEKNKMNPEGWLAKRR